VTRTISRRASSLDLSSLGSRRLLLASYVVITRNGGGGSDGSDASGYLRSHTFRAVIGS